MSLFDPSVKVTGRLLNAPCQPVQSVWKLKRMTSLTCQPADRMADGGSFTWTCAPISKVGLGR